MDISEPNVEACVQAAVGAQAQAVKVRGEPITREQRRSRRKRDVRARTISVKRMTKRELETLKLIARGLSNQEIATELFVHERTIAKYVSSILEKLQLANRTQAALYAHNQGLTEPRDKIIKKSN